MLIEQIMEFELRLPGPVVVHIFLKLAIFMTKPQGKSWGKLFNAKMLQKAICLVSSDLGQVTKFNPKMQDFKLVLDLTGNKEKNFFNWLPHLKIFFFKWFWKYAKSDPNGIKIAIFSKKLQNIAQQLRTSPSDPIVFGWLGGRSLVQASSVNCLSCTNLLTTSPNFDMLVKLFNLQFYSFPFSKSWLRAKSDSQLLIFHSLPHKKSLFTRIFDDVIVCDLRFGPPPQFKTLATPMH